MGFGIKIVVFLFFLSSFWLRGQEYKNALVWQKEKRLTWEDFEGAVPKDAAPAATTASGISYEYTANMWYHEVKVNITITAYFYPTESWYRPELANNHVLQHEQLHFDITELHARKMKFEVSRTTFTENVKEEINKIYRKTLKELKEMQERYDWETSFSRNAKAQQKWQQRISEALERLAAQP